MSHFECLNNNVRRKNYKKFKNIGKNLKHFKYYILLLLRVKKRFLFLVLLQTLFIL